MKISTKGRYSLEFLLDLARHGDYGPISLTDIAERKNISKKYLEQIIPVLNKSGFLTTVRGAHGGYQLAKSPKDITIADIWFVAENIFSDDTKDESENNPTFKYIVDGLDNTVKQYLETITLQDVLEIENNYYSDNYVI